MFKIPTFTFIFIIYITSLQGSAGSDDYEIIIPSVVQNNQSWPGHGTQLGPRYHVEKPVQLEILGPRNYNVREGEELALICHDKNNRHNNMIAWKRKDGLMPNGEIAVMGGQVIIEKIGREDGGEYECWNMLDNTTTTHKYVNVLYGPSISMDKLYMTHHRQLTLELVCSAQANPPASLQWSRMDDTTGLWSPVGPNIGDNTRDMDGVWTENRQVGSTESLSVVVISNPMTDHLGHYVCTANNSLGYDQKTVHLKGFNEEVKEPQHVTAAMSLGNQNFSVNIVIFIKLYSLIVIVQSI